MKLSEIYSAGCEGGKRVPKISVEIFPPKGEGEEFQEKCRALYIELLELNKVLEPSLVSITYGAGGSSRERSDTLLNGVLNKFNYNAVMPHFTCVCSSRSFIGEYLSVLKKLGVQNILALKGDEPEDIEVCYRDFRYAYELVEFIKSKTQLEIAVAGYPEGHIEARTLDVDIKHLKTKVDKGANVIFTQFFFENYKFYNYLELLHKNKIDIPTVAGILPVISYEGLIRMIKLSGIKPSKKVMETFEKYKNSKEDIIKAGIEQATVQTEDLIKNGAAGIHFYTLNKAKSTVEVLKNTGLCKNV